MNLFIVSIDVVHFKLPHTEPCKMTSLTGNLLVRVLFTLIAICAFLFSKYKDLTCHLSNQPHTMNL